MPDWLIWHHRTSSTGVLCQGLGASYVLVGDDFRFGARRAGDYAMLDSAGLAQGFDVARMNSYEVHGLRVSSLAVRAALQAGNMPGATRLLGHPYRISGHVVHGRKLGRTLGFKTLNQRFAHWKPAASGIFAVLVYGLVSLLLRGVANLGVRPSLDRSGDVNGGRVLLETHCLDWPEQLGAIRCLRQNCAGGAAAQAARRAQIQLAGRVDGWHQPGLPGCPCLFRRASGARLQQTLNPHRRWRTRQRADAGRLGNPQPRQGARLIVVDARHGDWVTRVRFWGEITRDDG